MCWVNSWTWLQLLQFSTSARRAHTCMLCFEAWSTHIHILLPSATASHLMTSHRNQHTFVHSHQCTYVFPTLPVDGCTCSPLVLSYWMATTSVVFYTVQKITRNHSGNWNVLHELNHSYPITCMEPTVDMTYCAAMGIWCSESQAEWTSTALHTSAMHETSMRDTCKHTGYITLVWCFQCLMRPVLLNIAYFVHSHQLPMCFHRWMHMLTNFSTCFE